jgi:uncharacterized membrane protein required for colicin V production
MKFSGVIITWFDLLLLALIVVGIFRGRKRGMSEELLDVLQWLTIIVGCSLAYDPFGRFISSQAKISLFAGYLLAYAGTAIGVKLLFTALKRMVGEKLVQSDAFGNFEYYLGMTAGALRYFCILLFCMSFLHAKYISDAERAATAKLQADNFGSISFPTVGSLQHTVFYESPSGKFIAKHLDRQLMKAAPAGAAAPRETIGRRRERQVDEVMK